MKVAFVHDWLITYRGGEKVLESLLKLFPSAPIYTLFYDRRAMPDSIRQRQVIAPAILQPWQKMRKAMLPLLPAMIESFDLSDYDLIISTSSCVAKGVVPGPTTKHLCYIHSPMRYIWDQREHYLSTLPLPGLTRPLYHLLSTRLRLWDTVSAQRVDTFIANSHFVAQRVKKFYGRSATVIAPPVPQQRFAKVQALPKQDFFLVLGAFVPYKRLDLAIQACEAQQVPLVVAGSGPEESRLRRLAGKNTKFVINPSDLEAEKLLATARGFLFPGVEDFGMTAVESLACGTPVIAFDQGGARDIVEDGVTGIFFSEQTPESLGAAIQRLNRHPLTPATLRQKAEQFSEENFLTQIRQLL